MNLLDFGRLQRMFETEVPAGKVKIFLFSKDQKEYVLHSSSDELKSFLLSSSPMGTIGECFVHDKNILCCIGDASKEAHVRRTNVGKSMKSLFQTLKKFNNHEIVFEDCEFVEDAVYYLVLASYSYNFLKKPENEYKFLLNVPAYEKSIKIAHAQNIARFLGDTPGNLMTPSMFVEYAKKILENEKVEIHELGKEFMEQKGMNLILSVSQGSVQDPKLLRIVYKGKSAEGIDVSVVGKGVCFDSGGISLKPSAEMFAMKYDMMGAATLLCSIKLAAVLKLELNLVGIFPLVENLPSGSATKPGDVFKSMSGKTVEVDNTDAEGRLILADGLTYAQQDSPKYLLNAATLTGAMCIALGSVYSGFFTHNQKLSDMICESGNKTNDLMWRMPLSSYYREALVSQVADINNMGGRDGSSCKAAEFLNEFVDTDKVIWAHFDIAGSMHKSLTPEIFGKGATGRPVPVFLDLFEKISKI